MPKLRLFVAVALIGGCLGRLGAADGKTLPSGSYSARIKALACDGCAPLVEKTLHGVKGVGPVHVDRKESRVHFAVQKGVAVKLSDLKAALDGSAQSMGMGADFSLSDLKADKPAAAESAERTLAPGYYAGKLGAIVCGGCKPLIETTLRGVPGVGAAQVDDKKGTVLFTVMTGKTVQLGQIQKALKLAADQMGMGADFSLSDVKPQTKG